MGFSLHRRAYTGANENKSTFMKNIEKFVLVAMVCVTLILCSGLIAYAIALPRYQVTKDVTGYLINDRFKGEIFGCRASQSAKDKNFYYGCVRIDPQHSKIIELKKF